jgi:hypothetical protein
MKGKLLFLAGTATGFVLGSKAGREAYERIRAKAQELWGDPGTQTVISQAETIARDAASVAQTKVKDLLNQAETSIKKHEATETARAAADNPEE